MRIIAATAVAFLSLTSTAHAQWALRSGNQGFSDMGIVEYQSRDWAQCAGQEQVPPARAISACGRIIGERFSREYTSAALFFRARLYEQQGDVEHARRDYDRAMETLNALVLAEPNQASAWNNRAGIRYRHGDLDGALDDYGHAVALEDTRTLPRMRRGEILFRRGSYAEAAEEFDAASRIDPESAQAQSARCEARAAAGNDWTTAREACNRALQLSAASSEALFSRGFLNFMEGRLPEAMADFRSAGERDNTNAYAVYGYGVVGVRMGFAQQGQDLIDRVTAAVPDVAIYATAGLRP